MPKGRPRKPTALLEASGAFEKNPKRGRERAHEPELNGPIGDPPLYFDDAHRAVWFEIASMAAPGVLAKSDQLHLELAVRLVVKMRFAPARIPKWITFMGRALGELGMPEEDVRQMKDAFRTVLGINPQEMALLATTLTRMGMTPADRSKVHGDKPKKTADPLVEILQQRNRTKHAVQ